MIRAKPIIASRYYIGPLGRQRENDGVLVSRYPRLAGPSFPPLPCPAPDACRLSSFQRTRNLRSNIRDCIRTYDDECCKIVIKTRRAFIIATNVRAYQFPRDCPRRYRRWKRRRRKTEGGRERKTRWRAAEGGGMSRAEFREFRLLVIVQAIVFGAIDLYPQHVNAGSPLGYVDAARPFRYLHDRHIHYKQRRTSVYRAKGYPILRSRRSWPRFTETLPVFRASWVNSPSTAVHLVPSPLQMPHLSSIASESNTQSHPTFCGAQKTNSLESRRRYSA